MFSTSALKALEGASLKLGRPCSHLSLRADRHGRSVASGTDAESSDCFHCQKSFVHAANKDDQLFRALLQEAAELDIRWVLMCKAGDLANGLGLSGVSSLERGGSGAGSVNSGGSDGGGSTNAADLLASPTRPPRGPGKLTKRRSASQELQEQLRTLWRNAAAEQEGGGFATGSLENRALDALADQVNIDEYLDRGGEWANRGTMSAPHSRTSSLEPGPRLPLSTPHSRSGSLDGSFLASSIESSPLHPAADGAVGSPEAGASTANAGPAVQIPESIGSQLGSGTLQAGSTSAKSGGGSLTPPSGGSGYNSSVGSSGSGSVGSSGSLSSNLSGFLAERQVGERELPVFDATLEKPLRRQTLVACIQKVAGEVARKEGPEGGAPAHFTAAGERYGIMGQGSGEREAAEGAPKSVHILLVVSKPVFVRYRLS